MAAAASSAATALYKYTYTLGRSLYVPLTSRCNSVPLPATRGPGFLLPRSVAEALVRLRDAECGNPGGSSMANDGGLYNDIGNWKEEEAIPLPPYNVPLVNGLYQNYFGEDDLSLHLERQRQNNIDSTEQIDDFLEPSIESLVNEVSSRLEDSAEEDNFSQVVIAGEGEPTLRMDALLAVAKSVQSFGKKSSGDNDTTKRKSKASSKKGEDTHLPIRVITNGLCYGIPNFGYSPYNNQRNGTIIPLHRHVILRDMMEAGVSQLSVALNTANRHEYDILMEPCCHTGGGRIGSASGMGDDTEGGGWGGGGEEETDPSALLPGTAHDIVCEFVLEATKSGIQVDITGVLRPGIDQVETERLARLLLSVGPRNRYRKQRTVRWRQYFS